MRPKRRKKKEEKKTKKKRKETIPKLERATSNVVEQSKRMRWKASGARIEKKTKKTSNTEDEEDIDDSATEETKMADEKKKFLENLEESDGWSEK